MIVPVRCAVSPDGDMVEWIGGVEESGDRPYDDVAGFGLVALSDKGCSATGVDHSMYRILSYFVAGNV